MWCLGGTVKGQLRVVLVLLAAVPSAMSGCTDPEDNLEPSAGRAGVAGDGGTGRTGGGASGDAGSGARGGGAGVGGTDGGTSGATIAGGSAGEGGEAGAGVAGAAGDGGAAGEPGLPVIQRRCDSSLDPGPCETPRLDLGWNHGCTLDTAGRVWCWGATYWNNEGPGVYELSEPPPGTFQQLAVGTAGCALDSEGVATCWGGHWYDWEPTGHSLGVPFAEISIDDSGGCGLTLAGKIECFGTLPFFSLTGFDAPDFEGTFVALSYSRLLLCALDTERRVTCWGEREHPSTDAPSGRFLAVSAGYAHACGITESGALRCWGDDAKNQASPPSGSFVQIAAGVTHSCGLRTDGTLACWGERELTSAPDGTFLEVSVEHRHSCARRADGKILCWGDDSGLALQVPPPFAADNQRYVELEVGGEYWETNADGMDEGQGLASVCGIHPDGTLACWGAFQGVALPPGKHRGLSVGAGVGCAIREDAALSCWSASNRGDRPDLPSPPDGEFTQISVGYTQACAVRSDGTLACWEGPLTTDASSAGPPPAGTFTQVAVTSATEPAIWFNAQPVVRGACALRADGDVVCWDATGEREESGPFVEISTACGLRADGTVTCWKGAAPPAGTYLAVKNGLLPSDGLIQGYEELPGEPLVTFGRAADFGCGLTAEGRVRCAGNVIR